MWRGEKKKRRKREGKKESPACFCPSTFVQMTGKQIRALKANSGEINVAESKRLHGRGVGNFHRQAACLGRTGRWQPWLGPGWRAPLCRTPFLPGRDEGIAGAPARTPASFSVWPPPPESESGPVRVGGCGGGRREPGRPKKSLELQTSQYLTERRNTRCSLCHLYHRESLHSELR